MSEELAVGDLVKFGKSLCLIVDIDSEDIEECNMDGAVILHYVEHSYEVKYWDLGSNTWKDGVDVHFPGLMEKIGHISDIE